MRNVARPVLDEVLKLAATGQIDVIVCREFERLARTKGRRWQAIQTALDYGVEFRFANLAPDGRLPRGGEAGLMVLFKEWMAEAESEKIADRLGGPLRRRFEDGLPHGGSNGPLYGYGEGIRRQGRHGRPLGLLTWVIDEEKAATVRWLYGVVDERDPADISLRALSDELTRRGIPTATGQGRWNAGQVKLLLTNPKFCGAGRNLRWQSTYQPERNPATNVVRDVLHTHDRMTDAEEWKTDTFPVAPDAIPAIISPEQWQRVQLKLKAAAALHNRGGARRTDAVARSALLEGHFVRCGQCGGKMTRFWASDKRHLYYQCNKDANVPTYPHTHFCVRADKVDTLALRLLARALVDPEEILKLADAASERLAEATVDADLAATNLAATQQRIAAIAAQQDELLIAQKALSSVPGMEQQIASIRTRLAQLDDDLEDAKAERSRDAEPRHAHSTARVAWLRQMFTARDLIVNFAPGAPDEYGDPRLRMGLPSAQIGSDGALEQSRHLQLAEAAALLGVAEDELSALDIPIARGEPFQYRYRTGTDEEHPTWATEIAADTVELADVVYLLLVRMGRERVRKLLRDMDAVVVVSRGQRREDYLAHGAKPLEQRVRLQMFKTFSIEVRTDGSKLSALQ
jgi:hypothetical protein